MAETTASNWIRRSSGKHVKLKDAFVVWFNNVKSNHACINDDMLIEQAKPFGGELGLF